MPPGGPIGRRPNSRCSSNGRRMDTSHRSWSTGQPSASSSCRFDLNAKYGPGHRSSDCSDDSFGEIRLKWHYFSRKMAARSAMIAVIIIIMISIIGPVMIIGSLTPNSRDLLVSAAQDEAFVDLPRPATEIQEAHQKLVPQARSQRRLPSSSAGRAVLT